MSTWPRRPSFQHDLDASGISPSRPDPFIANDPGERTYTLHHHLDIFLVQGGLGSVRDMRIAVDDRAQALGLRYRAREGQNFLHGQRETENLQLGALGADLHD